MKFCSLPALLLLSLLLEDPVCHALKNPFQRNHNNDAGSAKASSSISPAEMEDAATGTVRLSESSPTSACDAMMAKSLVHANEQMAEAQHARDLAMEAKKEQTELAASLKAELQHTTEKLHSKLDALKTELEAAKRQALEDLTRAKEEASELLAKTSLEYQSSIRVLEEENKDVLAKKEEELQNSKLEMKQVMAEKDSQHAQALAAQEAEFARRVKAREHAYEQLEASTKVEMERMEFKYNEQLTALTEEKQNEVVQLKDRLASQQEEKEKQLTDKQEKLNNEYDAFKVKVEKEKKRLEKALEEAEKEKKRLASSKASQEKKLVALGEDLKRWESLFGTRSYCNFTYISEDTVATANSVGRYASASMKSFLGHAKHESMRLMTKMWILVKPYLEKANTAWNAQMAKVKPHYDKHVKPHYDKYGSPVAEKVATTSAAFYHDKLLPTVESARKQLSRLVERVGLLANTSFDRLVDNFASSCPRALQSAKVWTTKRGYSIPTKLLGKWKEVCSDPRASLITFLQVICVALVVFSRRILLAFAWWLLTLPFLIIYTPIQYLFARKKRPVQPKAANGTRGKRVVAKGAKNGKVKKTTAQ